MPYDNVGVPPCSCIHRNLKNKKYVMSIRLGPCNMPVNVVFHILNAALQCLSDVFTLYPIPTLSCISFPYHSCCTKGKQRDSLGSSPAWFVSY